MLDWKYRPKSEREADAKLAAEQNAANAAGETLPEEKPESFGSRNVKIITFVICISVFLILFGPMNVFRIWGRGDIDTMKGKPMTQQELITLSKKGVYLTMEDLKVYAGQASENEYREIYTIEFEGYIVFAMSDIGTGRLLSCTLTEIETERAADVLNDDIAAYFAAGA